MSTVLIGTCHSSSSHSELNTKIYKCEYKDEVNSGKSHYSILTFQAKLILVKKERPTCWVFKLHGRGCNSIPCPKYFAHSVHFVLHLASPFTPNKATSYWILPIESASADLSDIYLSLRPDIWVWNPSRSGKYQCRSSNAATLQRLVFRVAAS